MISVSGKKWEQKKINQNLVDKIKQDFNFSDISSRLIISKKFGISSFNRNGQSSKIIFGKSAKGIITK